MPASVDLPVKSAELSPATSVVAPATAPLPRAVLATPSSTARELPAGYASVPDWAKGSLARLDPVEAGPTPLFLAYDFTGDGRRDYVVQVRDPQTHRAGIAIVSQDGGVSTYADVAVDSWRIVPSTNGAWATLMTPDGVVYSVTFSGEGATVDRL